MGEATDFYGAEGAEDSATRIRYELV